MLALEQIRALYECNEWANGHVLDAASDLSEEELVREGKHAAGRACARLASHSGAFLRSLTNSNSHVSGNCRATGV